jgi:maltose alpha-D-glucosyltransferase/alpha-amylase
MGDNFYLGDRNGVRTPMQWSPDRNAGFSDANPHKLYLPVIIDPEYHYEAINVETQQGNPHSLLRWIRRLIALRKRYRALGRGTIEFLQPENHRVLAFLRRYEGEVLLMVANLSRFVQHVELDLSEFEGVDPVELFGRTRFPRIGELTYLLTLGPHGVYWFGLSEQPEELVQRPEQQAAQRGEHGAGRPAVPAIPTLTAAGSWDTCLAGQERRELARLLPPVLATRRWFGGKGRSVRSSEVRSVVRIDSPEESDSPSVCLTLIELEYREEEPETYVLPLAFARAHSRGQARGQGRGQAPGNRAAGEESAADRLLRERPEAALARAELTEGKRRRAVTTHGVLYDAVFDPELGRRLLEAIESQQKFSSGPEGEKGKIVARRTEAFAALRGDGHDELPARLLSAEQSNTSVLFGDRLILKLFRKLEPGENPDLEIGRFLTEQTDFRNVPPVAGSLEYRPERSRSQGGEPATLAILQGYVDNEGDAWRFTLDFLSRYFERVLSRGELGPPPGPPVDARPLRLHRPAPPEPTPGAVPETAASGLVSASGPIDPIGSLRPAGNAGGPSAAEPGERELADLFGLYPSHATLLGQRTGELHLALASGVESKAFAPEPFSELYQRSLYQSMRSSTGRTFRFLKRRLDALPGEAERDAARRLLGARDVLLARFKPLLEHKIEALRIRCHGDYHLGQVLYTGKDFVIIDFEGEPARPLSERRIKRSPLRDVAGMLRSFDYAVHAALQEQIDRGVFGPEQAPTLEQWGRLWYLETAAAFLGGYLETLTAAGREPALIPTREDEVRLLLDVYLLDKAIYELRYELDHRPGWARIPLHGILRLIGDDGGAG